MTAVCLSKGLGNFQLKEFDEKPHDSQFHTCTLGAVEVSMRNGQAGIKDRICRELENATRNYCRLLDKDPFLKLTVLDRQVC